ncbi:hypothetical protein [Saccharibacter sp. 17.LH.SD]|nr:hypothetical protein [Saccharibacter sp. 17.LH.SD]
MRHTISIIGLRYDYFSQKRANLRASAFLISLHRNANYGYMEAEVAT